MRDLDSIRKIVDYFNDNRSTVRETAKTFGISKSAVHNYLTVVMPNPTSREILDQNKRERHIRGGEATKKKYNKMKRL